MPLNVTLPSTTPIHPATSADRAAANTTHIAYVKTGGGVVGPGLLVGLAIATIVLVVAILIVRRYLQLVNPPHKQLETSISKKADAIGIILSEGEKRVKFVPMYRIGSMFYYDERGSRKFFIPTARRAYSMGGKPAYVGIEYDRVAIESDPEPLAAYGVAIKSMPEELKDLAARMESDYDERRGLKALLDALAKYHAKYTGRFTPLEGVAVEIYPVRIITSMIGNLSRMSQQSLAAQSSIWETIEQSSSVLHGRSMLNPETGRAFMYIAMAGAILMAIYFAFRTAGFMH